MAENETQSDFSGYANFFNEFVKQSDRGLVIAAAAQADDALKDILKRFFRPPLGEQDDLLEGDSPLASFSTRIRATYRLGLIDDEMVRALTLLRKIRNDFAHDRTVKQLEGSPHEGRIRELVSMLSQYPIFARAYKELLDRETPAVPDTIKRFVFVVGFIVKRLEESIDRVRPPVSQAITLAYSHWQRSGAALVTPPTGASSPAPATAADPAR